MDFIKVITGEIIKLNQKYIDEMTWITCYNQEKE